MKVFNHFDHDGDSYITFEEAKFMASAFNLTIEELKLLFNQIDLNGDGCLEVNEFISFIKNTNQRNFIRMKIIDQLFDKDWFDNLINNKHNRNDIDYNLNVEDEGMNLRQSDVNSKL